MVHDHDDGDDDSNKTICHRLFTEIMARGQAEDGDGQWLDDQKVLNKKKKVVNGERVDSYFEPIFYNYHYAVFQIV